jgi:cystathionine beta-lyase/cystathionine gamma-synthase
MVICDNTFLTPSLLQPLKLSTSDEGLAVAADVVIHSAATMLAGHNDSVGGMIVTRDIGLAEQIRRARSVYGGILSPYHCFLMMRGIATLSARMRVHSENAMAVAKFLSQHSAVASVHYPGLLTDPGHPTSARLLSAGPGRGRLYGAMLGFTLHGGVEEIKRFAAHLSLCRLATDLGGSETLASVSLPEAWLEPSAATCGFVRLSVGIEHDGDIIADLRSALDAAQTVPVMPRSICGSLLLRELPALPIVPAGAVPPTKRLVDAIVAPRAEQADPTASGGMVMVAEPVRRCSLVCVVCAD